MWNFSLEGRIITLEGRKLKIEEQLTEVLDQRMGQRNVLVKTRNIESNIRSLIKMRYQLNPEDFEFVGNDNVEIMKIAWEHFCNEVQAAKLLGEAGLGPQYVDNLSRVQPKWMAFPGGYVDFLVMKPASGENLDAILEELTDRQLASIRTQLAHILEKMRQNGYKLIQQHPGYLNYDVRTNKLYLVDLAGLGFTDPNGRTSLPIDEDSPYVAAFNIRRPPYQGPEKAPEQAGKSPSSGKPAGTNPPSDPSAKKENKPPLGT